MATTARALLSQIPRAHGREQVADLFDSLADRYEVESWVADPQYSARLSRIIADAYRGKPAETAGIALAMDLATTTGLWPTGRVLDAVYAQAGKDYTGQAAENTIGVLMGVRQTPVSS